MFFPLSTWSKKYASNYQSCSWTAGVLPATRIISKHLLHFRNTSKHAWVWSGHVLVCFDLPSRSEQLGPSQNVCVCVLCVLILQKGCNYGFAPLKCIIGYRHGKSVTVMITETKSSRCVRKFIYFTVCQLLRFNSYLCCPHMDCKI